MRGGTGFGDLGIRAKGQLRCRVVLRMPIRTAKYVRFVGGTYRSKSGAG